MAGAIGLCPIVHDEDDNDDSDDRGDNDDDGDDGDDDARASAAVVAAWVWVVPALATRCYLCQNRGTNAALSRISRSNVLVES